MGWYTVTKTIKGRQYLYRQRTMRVGGKVRTENQYIGPAAGAAVGGHSPPSSDTTTNFADVSALVKEPSLTLHHALNRRPDISQDVLRREEVNVKDDMAATGLDVSTLASVKVGLAGKAAHGRKGYHYIVTAPRKGQRTRFKEEYRKALADRWLDELQAQNPERFERLRLENDRSYREGTKTLASLFLRSNSDYKIIGYLMLVTLNQKPWWWKGRKKNPLPVHSLDGESSDWRDDTTALMAKMIRQGDKAVCTDLARKARAAGRTEERAREKLAQMGTWSVLNGDWSRQNRKMRQLRMQRELAYSLDERALWVRWCVYGKKT